MSRRPLSDEPLKHEAWAVPYADLMTLMLAFFVVLYAVSVVHPHSRAKTDRTGSATHTAGVLPPIELSPLNPPHVEPPILSVVVPAKPAKIRHVQPPLPPRSRSLDQIQAQIATALAPLIRNQNLVIQRDAQWLKIELRSDILFPSGVAELAPSARQTLNRIAAILRPFDNPLRVEGYADDRPIHTAAFPSNWELSAARAGSVARLFVEQGLAPSRLGILGWGAAKPVAPNTTDQGRHRNRRVLLVVLSNHLAGVDASALPSADSQTLPDTASP